MSLTDGFSPDIMRGGTVLLPVGSFEQHGAHLPLDTDTVIATAVAERLAPLVGAVVAPAVAYGSSGEHQHFAGTASIGTPTLTAVLVELVRSLRTWANQVALVNGHGGNVSAVRTAVNQLVREGHDVTWTPCVAPDGDLHAGRTETSLMLHLDPRRVRMHRAALGNTGSLAELLPVMQAHGVAVVSPNGVLGDPRDATAEEGTRILQSMVNHAYTELRTMVTA